VGAAVAVGWVVAGCTGGGDPGPSPSVEDPVVPAPSETPEPTPTETGPVKPERPAAMERDDAEGAAAAAEYFLELYPYVMSTGDTTEWEAMSHPECEPCRGFIDQANTIAERGDVYSGGDVDATIADPGRYLRDEATGITPLDVEYTQAEILIADTAGKELYSSANASELRRMELGRRDGSWIIITIAPMPS
jgi:hypothetical protein